MTKKITNIKDSSDIYYLHCIYTKPENNTVIDTCNTKLSPPRMF